MVMSLTPIASLLDRGATENDIDGALTQATDLAVQFDNTGDVILAVSNGTVGAITATLEGESDPYGRSTDVVLTINASKIGFFPFMNPLMFNTGGKANVTLSSLAAGVKVGIWRLTKQR